MAKDWKSSLEIHSYDKKSDKGLDPSKYINSYDIGEMAF